MSTNQAATSLLTLEGLFRQTLRETMREVVREEIVPMLETLLVPNLREAEPQYLTSKQAALRTGFSEKTIRGWVREGRLAASQVGRALRIERRALADFLSNQGGQSAAMGLDVDGLARHILSRRKRK